MQVLACSSAKEARVVFHFRGEARYSSRYVFVLFKTSDWRFDMLVVEVEEGFDSAGVAVASEVGVASLKMKVNVVEAMYVVVVKVTLDANVIVDVVSCASVWERRSRRAGGRASRRIFFDFNKEWGLRGRKRGGTERRGET